MATTRTGSKGAAAVEGTLHESLMKTAAIENDHNTQLPAFVRMVVLEVFFDPSIIDDVKEGYYANEFMGGVSNSQWLRRLPRNSIIAIAPRDGSNSEERPMILFPFFSHLSLPIKPGEHVWVMFETDKITDIGYWMSRIVSAAVTDDVNYTQYSREFDPTFEPSLKSQSSGNAEPVYEFPNGIIKVDKDGNRSVSAETQILPDDEKAFEKLLTDSESSKITDYEPIPRFVKRPGDNVLEGSNNTLIVLGTTRTVTGEAAQYLQTDAKKGKIPKKPKDELTQNAGSIDIVVGRGQTETTGGKKAKNSLGRNELDKSKKNKKQFEGNPDLKNDKARVLIAQRLNTDSDFSIDKIISAHDSGIKKNTDSSAIVVKSDKNRIIAREDIVILVTGLGPGVEPDNIDPKTCASITIKTNGEIILTPANNSVLKLGGADANLAILCQPGSAVSGQVTAPPIIDTMGGAQGTGASGQGQFATKVLLK